MKVLTVAEFNKQVRKYYPEDWAQCHKKKGYVAVTDDFKDGAWGITEQSAINKFTGYPDRALNKLRKMMQ